MELSRHYQALNEFEFKRRAELNDQITIPLGILTLTSGFNFSLVKTATHEFSTLEYAVLLPGVLSLILLGASAVVLWKAHVSVHYKGPSSADQIEKYSEQLNEWADNAAQANDEFARYVQKNTIENAAYNARVNELRSNRILLQKKLLGAALVLSCIAASADAYAQIFCAACQ